MLYLQLPETATRQAIDATTVFAEYRRVRTEAARYAGTMYWKKEGPYEYLAKTKPGRRSQERLGRRSAETETTFQNYTARKAAVEERLGGLKLALAETQRMNRALKAGRVPSVVVAVLAALDETGLADHFTVVGTHALYAYEAAAGVQIASGALATRDVDLLWDARKRVRFLTDLNKAESTMLDVLRRADRTFERKEGQHETAINSQGFEVDFLRREPMDDDPHPFRFSDDEGDLWPVQARRASVLTTAARMDQTVIATNGRMAIMRTVSPQTFVAFKRWMAGLAPQRPEARCRRDRLQAEVVQALLDEGLLLA
jgi:hypothetical protein